MPPPITTTEASEGSTLDIQWDPRFDRLLKHAFQLLTIDDTFETLRFMQKTVPAKSVQASIADNYGDLSGALKLAADFIVNNGFEIATRSLRSVATESDLSPSSFSRLARAIGYEDYEQLREHAREELASSSNRYTTKAQRLHDDANIPFLPRQVNACLTNIQALVNDIDEKKLEGAVESLADAGNVTIVGSLGSASFADYFAYLTSWFDGRWSVAGRNGVTLASSLARLTECDVLIVITKAPYAKRAILATELAAQRGATIIVLTDSHAFPGIKHAHHSFIQKIESPQFFSSYAATLVLIETMTGMLLARAGSQAVDEIQRVVEQNRRLDEISYS